MVTSANTWPSAPGPLSRLRFARGRGGGCQFYCHDYRCAAPVGEVGARRPGVFRHHQLAGGVVLIGAGFDQPSEAGVCGFTDADGYGGLLHQVPDPMGFRASVLTAAATEHVEIRSDEPEPDLDFAWLAAGPASSGEVAVLLVRVGGHAAIVRESLRRRSRRPRS